MLPWMLQPEKNVLEPHTANGAPSNNGYTPSDEPSHFADPHSGGLSSSGADTRIIAQALPMHNLHILYAALSLQGKRCARAPCLCLSASSSPQHTVAHLLCQSL